MKGDLYQPLRRLSLVGAVESKIGSRGGSQRFLERRRFGKPDLPGCGARLWTEIPEPGGSPIPYWDSNSYHYCFASANFVAEFLIPAFSNDPEGAAAAAESRHELATGRES
jgi:hypothetical protein